MSSDPITSSVSNYLSAGLSLHREKAFAAAGEQYRKIPADHPHYPDALHNLGLLAYEGQEFDQAEILIRSAIALRPSAADFHYNLGNVLGKIGRHSDAITSFNEALRLRPQDAAAWNNLGNAQLAGGELIAAEASFRQALKFDRKNPLILCNLGNVLRSAGRSHEASESYRAALSIRVGYVDASVNLAALLIGQGQPGEAISLLNEAFAANPLSPDVLNSMGAALRLIGNEPQAEPLLRLAVSLRADFGAAWNNLGLVLKDLYNYSEAVACIQRAICLDPTYGLAYSSLGNIHFESGSHRQALLAYQRAVALDPAYAAGQWNLALLRLVLGEFLSGFAGFEWRLKLPREQYARPDYGVPLWRGEPIDGQSILLYAEQGLGDTLQFIRYVPVLVAQGAVVVVDCPPPLSRLLTGMRGISKVLVPGELPPDVDFACPTMSLPFLFQTTLATIPNQVPYLSIPAADRAAWAARLEPGRGKLKVGLVWAGDPRPHDVEANRVDRRRSIPLDQMAKLLAVPGIEFYSLQKGAGMFELHQSSLRGRLCDWSDELRDLTDTGALIEQLDLVISVDTAVVHLAGALGKPVWMMSRFDGCWRWLLERNDSPWYPTLRLFRQRKPLDWTDVIGEVCDALAKLRDGAVN